MQCVLVPCHFGAFTFSPSSTRRRMASGRERPGVWVLIHVSSVATSAGGTLTPIRIAPTRGLPTPRRLFLLSTIDLAMENC